MSIFEQNLNHIALVATALVSPQEGNHFWFIDLFQLCNFKSSGKVEVWKFYHLHGLEVTVSVEFKASKEPLEKYMKVK